MEKSRFNYWVDVLLVVCLIAISITGLVIYFAFVSGSPGEGRNTTFLGTHKSDWQPWHTYFGLAMIVLMFLHLFLNFDFLNNMTRSLFRKEEKIDSKV